MQHSRGIQIIRKFVFSHCVLHRNVYIMCQLVRGFCGVQLLCAFSYDFLSLLLPARKCQPYEHVFVGKILSIFLFRQSKRSEPQSFECVSPVFRGVFALEVKS